MREPNANANALEARVSELTYARAQSETRVRELTDACGQVEARVNQLTAEGVRGHGAFEPARGGGYRETGRRHCGIGEDGPGHASRVGPISEDVTARDRMMADLQSASRRTARDPR